MSGHHQIMGCFFLKTDLLYRGYPLIRVSLEGRFYCIFLVVSGKFGESSGSAGPTGTCRFCGSTANTGLLAIGNVCPQQECQVSHINVQLS